MTRSNLARPAFRLLRRRLARRRFSQLDLRLRLELALLGALLTAFVFWQVRAPFASLHLHGGARAVWFALVGSWVTLAALAAAVVAVRHAQRLRKGPPGLPWLALPIEDAELGRHLAWDSSLQAAWLAIPATGVWAGAIGLLPWGWLVLLAVPLAWVLVLASRFGAFLGERLAAWRVPRPDLPRVARILAAGPPRAGAPSVPPARWAQYPAWLALCAKDLRVTARVGPVARQFATASLFWLLSVAAWWLPTFAHARDLGYVAAFVLALIGSAALGEWLVALSGSDPFATLRTLPLGVATVWGARFALAATATVLLLLAHGLAARGLSPHALRLFLVWVGGATLAITALAVNYGVTLFPRADVARRMFGLSLGLAVVASLMIPLLGWLVLLSAVIHSARRLSGWARLEEA